MRIITNVDYLDVPVDDAFELKSLSNPFTAPVFSSDNPDEQVGYKSIDYKSELIRGRRYYKKRRVSDISEDCGYRDELIYDLSIGVSDGVFDALGVVISNIDELHSNINEKRETIDRLVSEKNELSDILIKVKGLGWWSRLKFLLSGELHN